MGSYLTGLWRNADFVKLWVAQTISLLGSSVSFLALPLLAVSFLNATPFQMGVLTTMSTLPALLFGLFAGVWVDRHRRRPILIATNIGQAIVLCVISATTVLGVLRMEALYVLAFSIAVFSLFFNVADQSMLPTLVGRDQLVEGNSKLEMSRSGVAIVGPGLAGGLIQLVTAPFAIVFDAATFVIAALCIAVSRTPEPMANTPQRQAVRHAISDGLRLVLGHQTLRAITGALATSALFTSILDAVLLLYLTRDLHLQAGLLGLAFACGSVGFMVGAFLQSRTTQRFGLNATLIIGLLLTGSGDLMIATMSSPTSTLITVLVLFVGQFCFGLGRTTFRVSQISLSQTITPDHMQGRMNATTRFVTAGFTALGGVLGGFLGVTIGLRWTLIAAATGELLAATWLLLPRETLTNKVAVAE